ncbi:MAG TPA: hypothetical protein VMM58_00670 [Bacteroidota bacterium]|nr:hypothetical protein [Bacteroidota bacterium]
MKNVPKTIAAVVAFALLGVSGAMAHPDRVDKVPSNQALVLKNFEYSLQRDDFPGIVESTIYNVVIYKNLYPDLDYSRLASMLQRVSKDNLDSSISYKAHLANMYLSYGSTINLMLEHAPSNHEYIFKQISEQLEQKFLASHD